MATPVFLGFPGGSDSKASACSMGHLGSGLVALSMQGVPVQSRVRDLRSHMPCSAAKKKKKKKLVKMMNSVGAQSLQLCPTLRQLSVTPWTVACRALLSTAILQARILDWVATPFSKGSS